MKYIIITLVAVLGFISCQNNVEEEETVMNTPCDPNLSFVGIVKPIIDQNCVQCHQGNRFPDLRTHQSISQNATIIQEEIQSRRMPIGNSLLQTDIDAIVCWIENGAQNN